MSTTQTIPAAATPLGRRFHEITSDVSGMLVRLGVAAIAFAAVLLAWPGITVTVMLVAFGTFLVVDGAYALYSAARDAVPGVRSWLARRGVLGVLAGIATLAWPGLTALGLLLLIGTWAVAGGIAELVTLHGSTLPDSSRFVLALAAVVSILFGVVMFVSPGDGAVALVTLVAATAIVKGVLFIAAGLDVRHAAHATERALH